MDSALEGKLDFAYDAKLGYLTACPTNVGTGMRASAMLHLPGLVLSELINQVIQAVNKIGLAVRGLYGEGTEAMGNLFQISNQTTLGEKEEEIIVALEQGNRDHHRKRTRRASGSDPKKAKYSLGPDRPGLRRAHICSRHDLEGSAEPAFNHQAGRRPGRFPGRSRLPIDELFIDTQPAHLQKSSQQKLNAEERDHLRAEIIRERLKVFPKPDISKLARESENGSIPSRRNMNNFTPRAQQVLALARKEADRFNHNYVGTEHLLLGLIKLGQGVAVNVLQKMGLDLETVRMEVEKQVGSGPETKMVGNIPYTPRVKKVLALAGKEAKALNHSYVGTEHILLGLLREGEGVAARVLKSLEVDIERTRNEILKELDPNFTPPEARSGRDAGERERREKGCQNAGLARVWPRSD